MKKKFIHNEAGSLPLFVASETLTYPPGVLHPERVFPIFNLLLVHEGTLFLREEGKVYGIPAGEWFIQTPGILHKGVRPQETLTRFTFVHFRVEGNFTVCEEGGGTPFSKAAPGDYIDPAPLNLRIPMSGKADEEAQALARELSARFGAGGSPALCQSAFLALLSRLVEPEENRTEQGEIAAYLSRHFLEEGFSLGSAAKALGYSRQYVTRLLRRETGKSFSAFTAELKVRHAKNLLAEKMSSPGEIARALGYADEAAFSHMFRRHTGLSPSEFGKLHKK